MKLYGNILIWVILIIVGSFLMIGSVFTMATFRFRGGELAKSSSSGGIRGGCDLPDTEFVNTSISDRPDEVISLLIGKYGERIPKIEKNIREVLAVGKERGLNAAIVLAMWNGESSFREDLLHKAFGYGNTDTGVIPGTQTWKAQVNGIYSRLEKARDNVPPYNDPSGEIMFTRLWYNYTTALAEAYRVAGNRWIEGTSVTVMGKNYDDPVGNRMVVLKLLVPQQLRCETLVLVTGASGSGISTCPGAIQRFLTKSAVRKAREGIPRVIILHYMAYGDSAGKTVLSVDRAYTYFNNSEKHVQYVISRNGEVYQFFPENRVAAGAAGYNAPVSDYGAGAISIHIENEGHFESPDKNHHETPAQVRANISLIKCLMEKYNISKNDVISHQEADRRQGVTGRRSDPGKRFMDKIINEL